MATKTVYRVRDMATGLFQLAGTTRDRECKPNWGKNGKTWTGLGHLRSHFNSFLRIEPTWEVIEYELVQRAAFSAAVLSKSKQRGG